jgi:hypothetical protein
VRSSDRWVTPGVIVVGIVCATVAVLGSVACVTYLTERGVDPDPMLKLVGEVVAAVSGFASLLLQLVNRRTTTKVERNTGVLASHTDALASAVYDVADAMPRPVPPAAPPRHLYPDTEAMPPVSSGAPGPRGS